jgi:hypothetical protein
LALMLVRACWASCFTARPGACIQAQVR